MKTSRLRSMIAFLFLATVIFTSCKKDDPQPHPIVGGWTGKYGIGNSAPSNLFSFNILANGKLQIRDANKAVIGTGTWKLEETTFYGVYTYQLGGDTYNMTAKYEQADNSITGSWGEGEVGSGAGEFWLKKE